MSTNRPHGGGYNPDQDQEPVVRQPRSRPHGGGYDPDQVGSSPLGSNGPTSNETRQPPPAFVSPVQYGPSHTYNQTNDPGNIVYPPHPQPQPTIVYQRKPAPNQSSGDAISKVPSPWVSRPAPPSGNYSPTQAMGYMEETIIEISSHEVPPHEVQPREVPIYSNYLSAPEAHLTRQVQAGRLNAFSIGSSMRWFKYPHVFKHPTVPSNSKRFRHRDSMARVYYRPSADRYMDSHDGTLKRLMVQTADEIYNTGAHEHSWRRTYIRKIGPYLLRAAYWPLKTVPVNSSNWTAEDKWMIAVRWLPSCLVLFLVLPLPKSGAEVMPGGDYFLFPYRYWGTFKVARNSKEDVRTSRAIHWNETTKGLKGERILRPSYLMHLKSPDQKDMLGFKRIKDDEWNAQQTDENMKYLPYVFVAYTADQFTENPTDLNALLRIAEAATRRAGMPAFWIGCSCMPDEATIEEDVYRINDVIRGAYSLVIAVGRKPGDPTSRDTASLLWEWGSRMWTFPEALLSPNDKKIEVFTRDADLNHPWILTKKDLASCAWVDADEARALLDHYHGTLTLSRLELVQIAMKCLHARRTDTYLAGDMSYALMGLLRRRPMVDRTDSEFQALARLSLANDNDLLLERLICVLPKKLDQNWIKAEDAWDVNLWDIYPNCQVAAIGDRDTVILDGCHAASIKWDAFSPVAVARKISWKRWFARLLVRLSPILVIIGAALVSPGAAVSSQYGSSSWDYYYSYRSTTTITSPMTVAGAIFLLVGLGTWIASPYLIRVVYGGKLWDQQAWIFGVEGYVDCGTLEALIFGYNMKRLTWSTCGSHLSRHSVNEYNEWMGRDPTEDPAVAKLVQQAKSAKLGEQRIFTIVDTFTMTVTLIQAARPPVMVLLCASEGGNQRAVMCSYDWKTQTLYKETVIRVGTQVLDRMPRIGRVNFGFFRPQDTDTRTGVNDVTYQPEGFEK